MDESQNSALGPATCTFSKTALQVNNMQCVNDSNLAEKLERNWTTLTSALSEARDLTSMLKSCFDELAATKQALQTTKVKLKRSNNQLRDRARGLDNTRAPVDCIDTCSLCSSPEGVKCSRQTREEHVRQKAGAISLKSCPSHLTKKLAFQLSADAAARECEYLYMNSTTLSQCDTKLRETRDKLRRTREKLKIDHFGQMKCRSRLTRARGVGKKIAELKQSSCNGDQLEKFNHDLTTARDDGRTENLINTDNVEQELSFFRRWWLTLEGFRGRRG